MHALADPPSTPSPLSTSANAVTPDAGYGLLCIRQATEIPIVLNPVAARMSAESYTPHDCFAVQVALEEAIVNAIRHGNRNDPSKQVRIWWSVSGLHVKFVVVDEGAGFDPSRVPDPTAVENLHSASGRGLLLMRSLMTWVRHSRGGTCVTMCKIRSAAPRA